MEKRWGGLKRRVQLRTINRKYVQYLVIIIRSQLPAAEIAGGERLEGGGESSREGREG